MLTGRRYRLALTAEQTAYAERVAAACRAVWNAALEQRQAAAQLNRGRTDDHRRYPSYASQCQELATAKATEPWLAEAPAHCLQQTLRDLDSACRHHGVWRVHWRSKRRWAPSFRFPDRKNIGHVRRLGRRAAEVRLPKLGLVHFRWSRRIGGTIRNATVQCDGQHWYVSFCIDDGIIETPPNGLPPVGVDRGVAVPVATSDGQCFGFVGFRSTEERRLKRLQRRLARQRKGSSRRKRTVAAIGQLHQRARRRRDDFCHQTGHRLTTSYGLIVLEELPVQGMTASARGTVLQPGSHVRQKAALNRAILDKSWSRLRLTLAWHGRKNGCAVVGVPAAYTSQTCSACRHIAAESRESQADFLCIACGYEANADLNAAKVILAAGLAVTARGALAVGRATKREPPERKAAHAAGLSGNPLAIAKGRKSTVEGD
jgi:IS605 OrfB family transposase